MIGIERLADVFVGVADTLVAEFDVIEFLHSVAAHATEMTGAAAAGLMLSDLDGGLHYMGASNESARLSSSSRSSTRRARASTATAAARRSPRRT